MSGEPVEITSYRPELASAFRDLNVEWLEKYFVVEPIDHEVLNQPFERVLTEGGQIFFALLGDEVVGTAALKYQGEGSYELTKMAVTERCQGAGIGRKLLVACIVEYRARQGKLLYLESHSSLGAALSLYESAGFEHSAPPQPSDYARADVYMIYRGP